MNASLTTRRRPARPTVTVLLALLLAVLAGGALVPAAVAADPSQAPVASAPASGAPMDPAAAMCQSASDLRLYIGWLREQNPGEDGWLPVLVGAAAAFAEARTLVGLVDETYRPLASDLMTSLESLRTAVRGLRDEGTVGSRIAELGAAILAIGSSMDALSTALREPCGVPVEPSLSPAPSPAA